MYICIHVHKYAHTCVASVAVAKQAEADAQDPALHDPTLSEADGDDPADVSTHIHMYIYIYTYTYVCKYICMHTHADVSTHIHMHMYKHT